MPEQFSLNAEHSKQHQLVRVLDVSMRNIDAKEPVAAILLHVARVNDKVLRKGLLYKSIQQNTLHAFLPWSSYFLLPH